MVKCRGECRRDCAENRRGIASGGVAERADVHRKSGLFYGFHGRFDVRSRSAFGERFDQEFSSYFHGHPFASTLRIVKGRREVCELLGMHYRTVPTGHQD